MQPHEFWSAQPVLQSAAEALEDGSMPQEILKVDPAQYPDTPLPLPPNLCWSHLDPLSDADIDELYKLLRSYYVEDSSHMFRFAYSKDLLRWWLTSPGCKPEYSIGIRINNAEDADNGKLVGYISGVVSDFVYSNNTKDAANAVKETDTSAVYSRKMQSIIFLCLDKKFRSLKLAPVLIQEITRRSYKNGVFQAVYTSGTSLSEPIQIATYYHRVFNAMKLARIGFCQKPKTMSDKEFTFFYKLPFLPTAISSRYRNCTEADIPVLYDIYLAYSRREYKFCQQYSLELFTHVVTYRKGTIHTIVYTENDESIPDAFITYYIIDTAVLSKEIKKQYPSMRNGYLYIYAIRERCSLTLSQLILMLMHDMTKNEVDVCTALNVGANSSFFTTQKFSEGSGKLNYYIFNLKWPTMALKDIGVVLI